MSVRLERNGQVMVGQMMPPGPGRLTMDGPDGHCAPVDVDEMGRFCLQQLPAEPIRHRRDARLVTAWVRF